MRPVSGCSYVCVACVWIHVWAPVKSHPVCAASLNAVVLRVTATDVSEVC